MSGCEYCDQIKFCSLKLAYRHESLWQPCWCDGAITCWDCSIWSKHKEGGDRVKRRMMAARFFGDWDDNDVEFAQEHLPDFFYAYPHGQLVVCLQCLAELPPEAKRELSARLLDVITALALTHIAVDEAGGTMYFYLGTDTHAALLEVRKVLEYLT